MPRARVRPLTPAGRHLSHAVAHILYQMNRMCSSFARMPANEHTKNETCHVGQLRDNYCWLLWLQAPGLSSPSWEFPTAVAATCWRRIRNLIQTLRLRELLAPTRKSPHPKRQLCSCFQRRKMLKLRRNAHPLAQEPRKVCSQWCDFSVPNCCLISE